MTALQMTALIVLAIVGPVVALTRDPLRQTFVLGVYGFALSVLFLTFAAPDVTLSATVVTTAGLPVMVLLALRRLREHEREQEEPGEQGEEPDGG